MVIALAAAWLAVGVATVAVMARRGHDPFSWTVVFLFLGPLAIPLAISADRHRPEPPPASPHDGALDMLVAHDAPTTVTGRELQQEAQGRRDGLAGQAARSVAAPVDTAVLFGEPCRALRQFAAEHGYELLVAGGPSRGPLVARGVAQRLTAGSQVPVLIGQAPQ